jgi:multiple sugar transport system permease protein
VLLFFVIVACSMALLLFRLRRRSEPRPATDDLAEATTAGARSGTRFAAASPTRDREPERPRRRRVTVPARAGRFLFGAGVAALLCFFLAPIAWIAVASVQTEDALKSMPPALSLTPWLDGYGLLVRAENWQGSFFVSLSTAVLTAAFTIAICAPAGYSLARFQIPGRRTILAALIVLQMVPAIVMAIPVLRVFQILGLKDTIASLVIVNVAFWIPLITWLLRNFFADVPITLERAARIDGCSRLGTLFRVTIQAARPGIAAALILIVIGTWNEFLFAVVLGDHDAVTITRLITSHEHYPTTLNETPPTNVLAAGALVAAIPCLVLVMLFHRRIITGLTEGFVKG